MNTAGATITEASSEPGRGGQSTPGDETQLANEIISTINDYVQRHPSTTNQQVLAGLD